MGLLKFIAIGAAVGYGVNYLIKKNENGRSVLDDLVEDAPQWFDKVKQFAEEKVEQTVKAAQPNG
ncbi:hypothetical protein [Mucilaginibacter pedocola]|uniref:YtxH domain-containing protein n=1 Tax=Mucilaginibacter pedocola TaxID=1792845 RepID=A0A1S9PBP1_9SPHI|nr:hypothetical protein [Mucilaginibacter pedocola]OOQ58380.1 hypothetical protein BC343_11500 [Mucilaginibacter pedocola]